MKMSLHEVEVEKITLSSLRVDFRSEEQDIGIAVFTDGCVVAFCGEKDEEEDYDEFIIDLNTEVDLVELFGLIKEMSLNNQEVR